MLHSLKVKQIIKLYDLPIQKHLIKLSLPSDISVVDYSGEALLYNAWVNCYEKGDILNFYLLSRYLMYLENSKGAYVYATAGNMGFPCRCINLYITWNSRKNFSKHTLSWFHPVMDHIL